MNTPDHAARDARAEALDQAIRYWCGEPTAVEGAHLFDLPQAVADDVAALSARGYTEAPGRGYTVPIAGNWRFLAEELGMAPRPPAGPPAELWDMAKVPYEDEGWDAADWNDLARVGLAICALTALLVTGGLAALIWWAAR